MSDKKPKWSSGEEAMYSISVYLDKFIGVVVENASDIFLGRISKAALYVIYSISPSPPPSEITIHVEGKDPISLKKIQRLDASWESEK